MHTFIVCFKQSFGEEMMKKTVLTVLTIMLVVFLSACGAPGAAEATREVEELSAASVTETADDPIDTVQEPGSMSEDRETETSGDGNELPTISGLGIDQGNYLDEGAGVKLNIQSTAWGGADEDVIMFTASKMYDEEFTAKILYPDKIYEIHFGDGMWYRYDPDTSEIIDPWFDVDESIEELTGKDAVSFSGEFVSYIDEYCIDKFGYKPEELIMMMYE
jgi:hypothetical protein